MPARQIAVLIRGLAAVMAFVALSMPDTVRAMEFSSKPLPDLTFIYGFGDIHSGDAERLIGQVIALPRGAKVLLRLRSNGGSILASESLAAVIRRYQLPIIVGAGDVCASGCFLVFAASPFKMFFPSSKVGVHSASEDSRETTGAMAMTTVMARSAFDLGVPAAIIGKMVTTTPGSMAWLSVDELAAMGGKLLDEPAPPAPQDAQAAQSNPFYNPAAPLAGVQPAQPAVLPSGTSAAPPKPPSSNVPPDEQSISFKEGRANRTAWEQWSGSLVGDARRGAEYWTGERSKRRPGRCLGDPEFQQACLLAQRQLAGPDTKRKTDPQYWWGWNSF